MIVVVSYDVPDDKRRLRLAKLLLDYGKRVQYSVFECDLTPAQMDAMLERVQAIVDAEADSVRVYRLCASCEKSVVIVGKGELTKDDLYILI